MAGEELAPGPSSTPPPGPDPPARVQARRAPTAETDCVPPVRVIELICPIIPSICPPGCRIAATARMKQFFEFLPIGAFFITYVVSRDIFISTAVLMCALFAQVVFEAVVYRHVEKKTQIIFAVAIVVAVVVVVTALMIPTHVVVITVVIVVVVLRVIITFSVSIVIAVILNAAASCRRPS